MNRLTAWLSVAALAAGGSLLGPAPAAQAATQRVTAADLGPGRAWIRLHDARGTTRHPGVEEIAPLASPDRFDGSLHLAVKPGQESQAAHYYKTPVALATILDSPLSYTSYVDSAHTTAAGTGPNLQLPMFCHGAFTTLSFQPQRATDGQGRAGVVPGVWQRWDAGPSSIWRTSRAVGDIDAGADAPLVDFKDACDGDTSGVIGLIGNAGTSGGAESAGSGAGSGSAKNAAGPERASGTLDAYVDNLTVNGTTYDFAVAGTATARITLRHDGTAEPSSTVVGIAAFQSPKAGPRQQGVGARLLIQGSADPDPGDVRVTMNGLPATVTRTAGGALTAEAPAAVSDELRPGATVAVPFTIRPAPSAALRPPASTGAPATPGESGGRTTTPRPGGGTNGFGDGSGSLTVDAELLAGGFRPLQPTGVHSSASIDF